MSVDKTRLAIALLAFPVSAALLIVLGPFGLFVGYGVFLWAAVSIRNRRETRRRIAELERRVAELEGDGAGENKTSPDDCP